MIAMLKADLHLHSKEDCHDVYIRYTAKELIDHASDFGFDVLSITHHWVPRTVDRQFYGKKIDDYAQKRGILLIPGVEARLKVGGYLLRKDVLLYNFTERELNQIRSFDDIKRIKQDHHLVIAAHPFFPHPKFIALGKILLERYIDLFDAIELHSLYTPNINFNAPAVIIAKRHHKPLVANSDAHNIRYFGTNYSLLKARPTIESVIKAIKDGRVEIRTEPMSIYNLALKSIPVSVEIALGILNRGKDFFNKFHIG